MMGIDRSNCVGFSKDCPREWGGGVVLVDFSLACPIALVSLLLGILCCIKAAAEPRRYAKKTGSSMRIEPTHIKFWSVTMSLVTGDHSGVFVKLT